MQVTTLLQWKYITDTPTGHYYGPGIIDTHTGHYYGPHITDTHTGHYYGPDTQTHFHCQLDFYLMKLEN